TSPSGPSVGTMEVYDPIQDTWDTTKAPMPTSRVEFGACAVIGKIYAIGGATNHGASPFGMVEEYDPSTGLWVTTKEPMPTPRKGAAYGVIDNKIYVAGGTEVANYTASKILEIYDPVTDTWDTTKAPMIYRMYSPTGAVVNNKFYVIGGLLGYPPWTGQKIVQMYDPTIDEWDRVADLDSGRVGHTTNGVAGKIYAIGGDRQPPIIRSVEEYDPNTNIWTRIDQTPFEWTGYTASVFKNAIYLISGSTTSLMGGFTQDSSVFSFIITTPAAPILISPTDSVNVTEAEFIWTSSFPEIDRYWFEIDTTDQFTTSFIDSMITDTTYLYSNLLNGKHYWWRVKAYNSLGWGEFSEVATFSVKIVSVEDRNQLPVVFSMEQNYPNPFNPSTKIKYSIPDLSFVIIKVFDVLGNEITTLVNEEKPLGNYEVEFDATRLTSGVYFYQLKAGSFVETKKMILMK
ncbi:MAG: T9SS type A sorting domain-containing protein, partial [Ignavibacteria bacterium]|nr:T9SS type A sorting domain-containing protein [Ignavibacteria bacterium]